MPESRFVQRIKGLWQTRTVKGKKISPIRHPINCFKAMRKGKKMQRRKHYTLESLGRMARARILNGPELNILMLGIPFLIDFGVSEGVRLYKEHQQQNGHHQQNGVQHQNGVQPVVVHLDPNIGNEGTNDPPLDPAPFSDQALRLYNALRGAGMSEDGARNIAGGEVTGLEMSEVLSQEDFDILAKSFEDVLMERFYQ